MAVTPTLYILMREDLQDLNPGKAMAQAAHAQADFENWVMTLAPDDGFVPYLREWVGDRSFGRTLVLAATLRQINDFMLVAEDTGIVSAGVTVDPTYPWRNFYGKVFLTSETTCAWAFVCEWTPQEQLDFLKSLPLHG